MAEKCYADLQLVEIEEGGKGIFFLFSRPCRQLDYCPGSAYINGFCRKSLDGWRSASAVSMSLLWEAGCCRGSGPLIGCAREAVAVVVVVVAAAAATGGCESDHLSLSLV